MESEQVATVPGFAPFGVAAEAGDGGSPPGREEGGPQIGPPVGISIGVLFGFDPAGRPLVSGLPGRPGELRAARSLVGLGLADLGREVALNYEGGDPDRPVIMGAFQPPRPDRADPQGLAPGPVDVRIDGEGLVLTAQKQIVLRCGEASITLTRAGKVLIRGAYLSSRSTGLNRIKGGVVHIN